MNLRKNEYPLLAFISFLSGVYCIGTILKNYTHRVMDQQDGIENDAGVPEDPANIVESQGQKKVLVHRYTTAI